jgi:hypothetical protein
MRIERAARWIWIGCLGAALAGAQQQGATPAAGEQKPGTAATHMTAEQAQQLFALVDELIQFSSTETGLQVKSAVKRRLTTRDEVEKYLDEKFSEDQSAKRLQQNEIVLRKFGLLDRDFELKPFLVALLKEQIEAYYDPKTKTVNLLDWVSAEEQKPVMAHELTHALQDQYADLEKWDNQTPEEVSTTASADTDHVARDEMDSARDAVTEGQATAVMVDYVLKPMGKSLVKDPEVLDAFKEQMSGSDSPVMARAPLLLSESMLFPYRDGLSFEQDVWMDKGRDAAFAGTLTRPPRSSWEILNPREYEKQHMPAVPLMPNIHPLVDGLYKPLDIGQVGQLDVEILSQLMGGERMSRDLTPAWDGGIYWAGQLKSAKSAAEKANTRSLALFYLSAWKSPASAQLFASLYADNLGRKYSDVKVLAGVDTSIGTAGGVEQRFSTSEGPVVITTRGKLVFVSESFELPLARRLTALVLDAQGVGEERLAKVGVGPEQDRAAGALGLSGDLVRLMESAGVTKAAVEAALRSAH